MTDPALFLIKVRLALSSNVVEAPGTKIVKHLFSRYAPVVVIARLDEEIPHFK